MTTDSTPSSRILRSSPRGRGSGVALSNQGDQILTTQPTPSSCILRSPRCRPRRGRAALPCLAILALAVLGSAKANATPTVNGRFYGDGDHLEYAEFATTYYGSKLYVFYDAPTTTLYVAFVVEPSVNENVFGQPPDGMSSTYMASTGWGMGGGQQRGADTLIDSEFAGFRFACEPSSARDWSWEQGYACLDGGGTSYVSDSTCGTSTGPFPPSLVSASSFAWNINTYEAAGTPPWDRDLISATIDDWVSPFDTSMTGGVYTPVGLDGYPSVSSTPAPDCMSAPAADLTTVTYSSDHDWEWRMIYEWSLDLGPAGADCGSSGLFLVTGLSHHSPAKDEITMTCIAECGDENDCFPPDVGGPTEDPLSDYGDLPDSYDTLRASGGAQHHIKVVSPYLGSDPPDSELDGAPSSDAEGDDGTTDDEDGVVPQVSGPWNPGTMQSLSVTVNGTSGSDDVVGAWLDWNNDGDFDCPDEFESFTATSGDMTYTLTASIPSGGDEFDWMTDDLHARFRIFSSDSVAPGGSLDCTDHDGAATDGEVEDYVWPALSLPVTLRSFEIE